MKTDRLYALTLYLLNHGKSSASVLAKHFEVYIRTIQRDINALCQAGKLLDSYPQAEDFMSRRLFLGFREESISLIRMDI